MSSPIFAGNDEDMDSSTANSPDVELDSPNVVPNSPLNSMPNEFRSALDEFHNNWQRELKNQSNTAPATIEQQQQIGSAEEEANDILSPLPNTLSDGSTDSEQQLLAESLFRRAVELEQRGKVYDALPFYRKAVQIVPDIEFKFYEHQKLVKAAGSAEVVQAVKSSVNEDVVEESVDDLYEKFQLDLAQVHGGRLLLSNLHASVISTEVHISDLPPEILLYILRWVVSEQLDLRSLEQCAAVCKGLYLCARDEDIWRLACMKVWGINVGTLNNPTAPQLETEETIDTTEHGTLSTYASWRQMFIDRERVLFNGCYISKTTYLRMGENNFQDQYYRPVQLVEYYRYIRFLPDGMVLMMTNSDEPTQGVSKLKHMQQLRSDVLRGSYRLFGSTVTIFCQKQRNTPNNSISHQYARHRRGSSATFVDDINCTKYCIEFRIMNTPKRKFSQLIWMHYSIVQTRNKVETSSEFDLTASKYPPLWFSPVRSYHLDAETPLA